MIEVKTLGMSEQNYHLWASQTLRESTAESAQALSPCKSVDVCPY